MKLSKTLLQAMMVAVTAGTISSCEKPKVDDGKKPTLEKSKPDDTPSTGSTPLNCPACGMG